MNVPVKKGKNLQQEKNRLSFSFTLFWFLLLKQKQWTTAVALTSFLKFFKINGCGVIGSPGFLLQRYRQDSGEYY